MYSVKEIFYTLQGEGANAGRAAVFCRFTGCNLWSGHEKDRASAVCQFCDTDFVLDQNSLRFGTAQELAGAIDQAWPAGAPGKFVVFTGGEPLLQLDSATAERLHQLGFEIAVETNGTQPLKAPLDWVCVSPKAGTDLVLQSGNELKVVYPQPGLDLERLRGLRFDHFYLQPMDGPNLRESTDACIAECLKDPRWRLSLQAHKIWGVR